MSEVFGEPARVADGMQPLQSAQCVTCLETRKTALAVGPFSEEKRSFSLDARLCFIYA